MNEQTNSLNWFEIPVLDMARARHFYQVAFGIHMQEQEMMGVEMAFFPMAPGNGKASGALVKGGNNKPATEGTLVYLNANPDMSPVLERIVAEGCQVILPKTLIDENTGYMAFFLDTEGNKVGIHSQG